ncbi:unnamed protein product [Lactuca saligna]|uniref:ER lumen protein-retaining receptor n=1 Tax=Lactuca saligna TaxID=75948 RepID=A0AA35ZSM2_LACSI|nr:unnamed protein product [Lactuca saligna]CAI9290345.1 unnamed protein product [Lactuca saligna]CAI9297618.1 unnamed protein product [Lactuca saligna]
MKTGCVALVLCLNISVDSPDVIKISPCARIISRLQNVQICWAFSIYLEAVAILPQLVLLQRSGNVDNLIGQYVFFLGAYRALNILNWICRYLTQPHFNGWISCFSSLIQTALYADFFYYYFIRLMICQECSDYFPRIPHGLDPVSCMFKKHVAAEGTTLVKQAEDAASNNRLQVDPGTWPIMIFRVC